MQIPGNMPSGGALALGPAVMGVMLIGFGILIIVMPQLLTLLVASMFIMAGIVLLGVAFRWRQASRSNVVYRRVDQAGEWFGQSRDRE